MNIQIEIKGNSFLLNGKQYQKGTLAVDFRIPNAIYFGHIKTTLAEVTADGETFGSIEELETWTGANLFSVGGSAGGNGGSLTWSDTSWQPVADKVAVFSEQGLLSTGMPQFPENAVPLVLLDIRIPEPPTTGNYRLRSVNGVVSWATE